MKIRHIRIKNGIHDEYILGVDEDNFYILYGIRNNKWMKFNNNLAISNMRKGKRVVHDIIKEYNTFDEILIDIPELMLL